MNGIRERVEKTVRKPDAAEALKPWYRQFCKRPTFNDEYLPTFNRPNVTLIDTSGAQGVERITKNGVVANGVEYPVDCIIFATGFEVGTAWTRRAGYDIVGKDGLCLSDYWADRHEDAARFLEPRLPQLLSDGAVAERVFGEPDVDARRSGPAHRLHHQAGHGTRRAIRASDGRSGSCVGRGDPQAARSTRPRSSMRARPATTTTKDTSCSAAAA